MKDERSRSRSERRLRVAGGGAGGTRRAEKDERGEGGEGKGLEDLEVGRNWKCFFSRERLSEGFFIKKEV